ncbi:MAG: hypothetical protein ACFB16_25865 [Phormidesmis sp.]
MANDNKEKDLETGAKQTPLEGKTRTTGQGSKTETRDGAEPEAPGNDGTTAGSPNQGTEAR